MSGSERPEVPRPRSAGRRTRIVATLGPASDSPATIRAMVAAGMDVARVPLAHGSIDDALERVRRVRSVAPAVGILADLPGPKIRTAPFPEEGVTLVVGDLIHMVPDIEASQSSAKRVGIPGELVGVLTTGDRVALADGGVTLLVIGRTSNDVLARVEGGGRLQGRPGVTAPSHPIAYGTPTEDDLHSLEVLVHEGVEAVAISFVRAAGDIEKARAVAGPDVLLVAKIETPEAVTDLEGILETAGCVMVARGDLGVRVPLEDVPFLQKEIIHAAVRFGRPAITATQMLESMTISPTPTRAEVTDVANAVLDGTSAVMLSGETAIGRDPAGVVATMARIVRRAEEHFDHLHWGATLGAQQVAGELSSSARMTAAITAAAWRAAYEEEAAAIVVCTRSGATARAIARYRPAMPLVAATPSALTAGQLTLSWGVKTLVVPSSTNTDHIIRSAVHAATEAGYAAPGDVLVVLAGSPNGSNPVTDTLRLIRVE